MFKQNCRFIALTVLLFLTSGCCSFRRSSQAEHLSASQLRSQELFAENEQLVLSQNQLNQAIAGLETDRQALSQQVGQMSSQLAAANSRIDNLMAERTELKQRYESVLRDTSSDPLMTAGPSSSVPGFQHDGLTGLSKFPEDIIFDLGSAEIRPEAYPVLKEFAEQVNSPSAAGLRLLIVGHTDDQRIARPATAARHPTNWHLSTDRADQVILKLAELGVKSERMAAMGYSRFQPLEIGTDESSRQRNRRVELYIVPESNNVAAWDPVRSLN